MENVNIIFLTNKAADLNFLKTQAHLKEYTINLDQIEKCWLVEDFAFAYVEGNPRFYDWFLENDQATVENVTWKIVDEIKSKAFNAKYKKTILAVHWGERDKDALISFLHILNEKNEGKNDVIFSYWGSQSETYNSSNLNIIKDEIIEWANKEATNKLDELLEAIEIHIKAIGRYNGERIEPGKETDMLKELENISEKLESLKAKLKSGS